MLARRLMMNQFSNEDNKAGDVAYWDGSKVKTIPLSKWNTSLGTAIGVVVVPKGFAPDGKVRIIGLKAVNGSGDAVSSDVKMSWGLNNDTPLTNYTKVPITDNTGSTSTGSNDGGYLPSDLFTSNDYNGDTSFVDPKAKYFNISYTPYIPSPYLGDGPNPEYYKVISGNNALSDFNGLQNTQTIVGMSRLYTAPNSAYKYSDGVSNTQWYLPAMGELCYLAPRFNEINAVITALGGFAVSRTTILSSTENSKYNVYVLTNIFYTSLLVKSTTGVVRPFACLS